MRIDDGTSTVDAVGQLRGGGGHVLTAGHPLADVSECAVKSAALVRGADVFAAQCVDVFFCRSNDGVCARRGIARDGDCVFLHGLFHLG